MTQMFVFTAGSANARQHLLDSIENPIDEETVFDSFGPSYREELEGIREQGNGFYAWGAVPGEGNIHTWRAMKPGDYVLCVYDNNYHYVARVLDKYNHREFAERVWGTNDDGETWQYMYFLTEPDRVAGHVLEVVDYLRKGYFGFTKISDRKRDAILNEFGSVDGFIHKMLNGPEGGVGTTHGFAPVTQQDLDELEDAEELDRNEVDRELAAIRDKLAQDPELWEGLDRRITRTSARGRSAAFEISVKKLYGYRCAICGSALETPGGTPEVQSAHIYPKRLDGSDDVRNGICLCRRHHWAMDAGWISIDDDYTILVREDLPLHDGYRFIRVYQGERIRLPSVAEAAPDAMYLQEHRRLMRFE
jgi:HNH endonuclease